MLKVPTRQDRAWQCLVKFSIEPAHEARFHARSYGFRPGRCAQDAQQLLFSNLNSSANGKHKKVLELDIEKCLDRISHNALMVKVDAPCEINLGLWKTLKAGVNPGFSDEGTPQGGVISPLLANIVLDGIEDCGGTVKDRWGERPTPGVRYADDMVFVIKPDQDAKAIFVRVKQFLNKMELKTNAPKTRLVSAIDGFDFLGWHFGVRANGKLKVTPSEDNFMAFRRKIKIIINSSCYGAKVKAAKLTPIVRGWRNHHKYCSMSGSRNSLWHINHRTWKVLNKERKQDRHSLSALIK